MNNSPLKPQDRFEIGGEDLLPKAAALEGELEEQPACVTRSGDALDDIRVRIGTLLKTETVSLLLGAGASVDCGGQLIGSIPLAIERDLQGKGVVRSQRPRIRKWLSLFYLAVRYTNSSTATPTTRDEILARQSELYSGQSAPLNVNFERVLETMLHWREALPESGGRLRIDGTPPVNAEAADIDEALRQAKDALAAACNLPSTGKESGHATHKTLVRKLLTRPLNLKRVNVFTLNYDTLVEQAADAEGVVLLDGFVGTQRRVFRPESYEQDLYFPAETTEGRVHRFDRVLHLYKLHGSITWRATDPSLDNPYGVFSGPFDPVASEPLLIYPTPAKYGETLGIPYSELFRRFAAAVTRPQSVLFVIGFGFGDEHVNKIILQALAIPSFTLVIVDPNPTSAFVSTLREQRDRRIWIAQGPTVGTISGFVEQLLPDLRDEEIRKKVLATYRALAKNSTQQGEPLDDE